MANHFKFIQVPVVFLLKLQNEEARMEAAFLALPYLVLVVVFLLQLLVPKDESEEAATHGGALCF